MSAHEHSGTRVNGATAVLLAVVIPLALLTLFGLIALWPSGDGPQDQRLDPTYNMPGGTLVEGTITSLRTYPCPSGDERPQGSGLTCVRSKVEVTSGPDIGARTTVDLPPGSNNAGIEAGDQLRLLHVSIGKAGDKAGDRIDHYAFVDFVRGLPMALLAVAYAVVVVAVARMRGLRALIGLVIAFAVVGTFMLPGLLEGKPPVLVGLFGASAIMLVVLYLAHGFSARTTTALLGTFAGLVATALLGAWATGASRLTGATGEEARFLLSGVGSLNLSAVLLCGIVLAGLGVLNDVTITQTSAVWELHALSPDLPARRLFAGAMRIGRDHIASTVYTIAFAYAGAALPVLLLLELYQRPLLTSITSGALAEEIVRTLVGSIGLVLAIPLTTAIAVAVVKAAHHTAGPDHGPDLAPQQRKAGRRRRVAR